MSTQKITRVERCQKPIVCEACGVTVEKGQPYKWFQFFRSVKRTRCANCPDWKPSERESNDKLADLYGAQEDATQTIADATELANIANALRDAKDTAMNVAEMFRESASNIEEGFGTETEQTQQFNENADMCDDWAAALDQAADEVESSDDAETEEADFALLLEAVKENAQAAIDELQL